MYRKMDKAHELENVRRETAKNPFFKANKFLRKF